MSTTNTANLKKLAGNLLALEAAGSPDEISFQVTGKMRIPLSKVMGISGFRALFSRSLALAAKEFPAFRTLQIETDGSFVGLNEWTALYDAKEIFEAELVLVTQLLGLLVTFIGGSLTHQLLSDIWPSIELLDFKQ